MGDIKDGGRFIVMGVPGRLDEPTREAIREIQPGGFILFGRNIGLPPIPDDAGVLGEPGSPEGLRAFIDELRSLVDHEPVVTLDQEGGRVSRLRGLRGGAEPPSARSLAEKGSLALIERHGALTGRLLRLFGFNLNLCPVLDVAYDHEADNSLKNRCYGVTPAEVSRNARAFARAMRAEGVLATGKHFPGYSRAAVDPHHDLPVVRRSRAELAADEWIPFCENLTEVDFIMTGHAFFPGLDASGLPTSLSKGIVEDLLRRELGFAGWVISDDLDMGAITRHKPLEEATRLAVEAGTDLLLLCHDVGRVRQAARAIAELPAAVLRRGAERLEKLRERLSPPAPFSLPAFEDVNRDIAGLRAEVLGPGAPPFTGGSGKVGAVEAAKLSPVNTVGDRAVGAPKEYSRRRAGRKV